MKQNVNIRVKVVKTLKRKHGSRSLWPWIFQWILKTWYETHKQRKRKIDKLDYVKLNTLGTHRHYQESERQLTDGEKYFQVTYLIKD